MVPWSPDSGQVMSSGHLRGQAEKHMVSHVKQQQEAVVIVLKRYLLLVSDREYVK